MSAHRPFFRRIEAHFARAISTGEERELRLHLRECATCRQYYERHLLLEKLDPASEGSGAEARIAAGLGLGSERRRATAHYALAAAVTLVLALGLPSLHSRLAGTPAATTGAASDSPTTGAASDSPAAARSFEENEVAARGVPAQSAAPHLLVYRFRAKRAAEPVENVIGRNDELAFAYANPEGFDRVLIFGVDEHRHVYWYHPAWSKQGEDPTGVTIATGPEVHELTEAVRQPLDGHTLRLIALFTKGDLSVKTVERMLRTGDRDLGRRVPGSRQIEKVLEIER